MKLIAGLRPAIAALPGQYETDSRPQACYVGNISTSGQQLRGPTRVRRSLWRWAPVALKCCIQRTGSAAQLLHKRFVELHAGGSAVRAASPFAIPNPLSTLQVQPGGFFSCLSPTTSMW